MNNDTFLKTILAYKDVLFRLALSIIREKTEAEDIVQDVFVKLWNKKDEWKDIKNLEAYCYRATQNMALDRLASKGIRKTDSIDQQKEEITFIDIQTPLLQIVQEEKRSYIYKCIDQLSENQKIVFQLREIEEKSYKEISTTLNISEDLVKVTLFRARQKLKDLLSDLRNEY